MGSGYRDSGQDIKDSDVKRPLSKGPKIGLQDQLSLNAGQKYRSTSLSQSLREWRNYFESSEVRHKQNVTSPQYDVHVQFLQDILLQYMCSQTGPTENQIEMKTKKFILVSLISILITLWTAITPQL